MATITEISCISIGDSSSDPFDIREVWFTNMLLLGFDPIKAEIKHKITFDKDTFSIPPQKQAMEVVLHYLFSQLNPQLSYEEFRDCWPVYDKKQDQVFRRKATNWITSIAKEEPSFGLPHFIAPLLLSPGGDKFYNFLFIFSSYCLQKVLLREAKGISKNVFIPSSISNKLGPPLFNDVHELSTQLHAISQRDKFLSTVEDIAQLHCHWSDYSKELVQLHQSLLKEKKQLENRLQEIRRGGDDNDHCPTLSQMTANAPCVTNNIKRKSNQEKVSSLWQKVNEFIQRTENERDVIETVVSSSNLNKYSIEGNNLIVQAVPERVLHHNESSLHHNELAKTPINLTELTQVCTEGLKYLHKYIHKGSPLSDLSEEVEFARSQLRSHSSHVTSAQQLKSILMKHDQSLEEMIQLLESKLQDTRYTCTHIEGISSRLPIFNSSNAKPTMIKRSNNVSLLPPSPQVVAGLTPPTSFTPYRPIVTKTVASTPRAIESITRNIQQQAKRQIASKFIPERTSTKGVTFSPVTMVTNGSHDGVNNDVSNHHNSLTPVSTKSSRKVKVIKRKERIGGQRREEKREVKTTLDSPHLQNKPPPSDELVEEIMAVVDPNVMPTSKNVHLEEEKLAFVSKDCIERTPIGCGERVKKSIEQSMIDTPSGNWLSKETPPTPFHEVCSESPEDALSLTTPTNRREPLLLVNTNSD